MRCLCQGSGMYRLRHVTPVRRLGFTLTTHFQLTVTSWRRLRTTTHYPSLRLHDAGKQAACDTRIPLARSRGSVCMIAATHARTHTARADDTTINVCHRAIQPTEPLAPIRGSGGHRSQAKSCERHTAHTPATDPHASTKHGGAPCAPRSRAINPCCGLATGWAVAEGHARAWSLALHVRVGLSPGLTVADRRLTEPDRARQPT
jgi:hypothetical protein|eukprot:1786664-Prymnesium_polylepis.1